jgi:hypothetical protein
MTPVWQAAIDLPPVIWWSHLEWILLAIDDLGCRDLLASYEEIAVNREKEGIFSSAGNERERRGRG